MAIEGIERVWLEGRSSLEVHVAVLARANPWNRAGSRCATFHSSIFLTSERRYDCRE